MCPSVTPLRVLSRMLSDIGPLGSTLVIMSGEGASLIQIFRLNRSLKDRTGVPNSWWGIGYAEYKMYADYHVLNGSRDMMMISLIHFFCATLRNAYLVTERYVRILDAQIKMILNDFIGDILNQTIATNVLFCLLLRGISLQLSGLIFRAQTTIHFAQINVIAQCIKHLCNSH